MTSSADERPLAGVRILDLTRVVAGPHSTRMLAALGADVIKLEPPEGDQTRAGRGTGHPSPPGFVQLNLGKRLIAVDLAQEEGRQLVHRLAGAVDVLIENFRPGVMTAWGLDYDALSSAHPGLVYVSISGYGQTGSWRGRRAYAPFVHGEAGYLHTAAQLRSAEIEHDPMSIADLAAAKDATIAMLAALLQRQRTGRGQHVDISLAHSMLFLNEFASTLLSSTKPPKSGSTPQAIFSTADGATFSAGNPVSGQVFGALCRAFGCPDLIDDARFHESGERRSRRAEVIATLQSALLERGGIDEVEAALNAEGLAVGRIRTVADVPSTEWAVRREAVVTVHVDGDDDVTLPSPPWRLSGAPAATPPRLGRFGADNDDVLAELLGMDEATIAALYESAVLRRDGTVATSEPAAGGATA
ncbi:MAG: putative CoA-transferase [Ilumatobacteraceae bacterium]|nr:putative CoA-transferase [Ilumatobacteraceae bacterium]